MLRALGLRGSDPSNEGDKLTSEEKIGKVLKQAQDFETCLTAMDYVLDDHAQTGLDMIEGKQEAIYKLATGVVQFIEFTIGFEPEMREKAQKTLAEAESLSAKAKAYNERMNLKTSSIFPAGTEYTVTLAESTLLNALCMLLSESMIESAKALYKLRKAYQILDDLSNKIDKNRASSSTGSFSSTFSTANNSTATLNSTVVILNKFVDVPIPLTEQQKKDAKIVKHCEKIFAMRQSRFDGSNIGNESANTRLRADLGLKSELLTKSDSHSSALSDAGDVNNPTIDEFIHSGVYLCFGILQVVLSLIPPAIGRVLSIVGFKGSRESGLKMLWDAAELRNIHGSLALLALLIFYDGPMQFTDTNFDLPDNLNDAESVKAHQTISRQSSKLSLKKTLSRKKMELESRAQKGIGQPTLLHPGKRLESLLLNARASFPNSVLWLLQEGWMLASQGRLTEALELLDYATDGKEVKMQQLEALVIFDRAMILAFLHQYERAAKDFIKLVDINAWSPGLYYYAAGSCYLECWRMCQLGLHEQYKDCEVDISKMDWYKEQATKYLTECPDQINKKRKSMPFDKYFMRKITAIKQNSSKYHLPLHEAVGTSLIHELCYFWNGYNRMPQEQLELSYKLLQYNAQDDPVASDPKLAQFAKLPEETTDQLWIRLTLEAITLRRLGKFEEGLQLIDKITAHILTPDYKFHKHLTYDPWLYPTVLYEKALFIWKLKGMDGLDEVREWLHRSLSYAGGDFELSTRVSMKTKAAIDRLEGL